MRPAKFRKLTEEERKERSRRKWRNYYKKHRKEITEKKNQQYKKDPEYRARARRIAAEQYEALKKTGTTARPKKKSDMTVKVELEDGRIIETMVYGAAEVAAHIGRTAATLAMWEKRGWMPPAMYRTTQGRRLYTALQVDLIIKARRKVKRKLGTYFSREAVQWLSELFHEIWEKYPNGVEE